MTVHAPFRFAPIPDEVYFPPWGPLVSHDVPFKDGLSGEIAIEIEAKTPLLVGGKRRRATNANAGEVRPFRLPDGSYALPGSSLQGMIRSTLEVASFARLGPFIYDRRMAMRDLKSLTGKEFYQSRMTRGDGGQRVRPQAKPGWLIRTDRGAEIRGCKMARIHFDEIARLPTPQPRTRDLLREKSDADDRAKWFVSGGGTFECLVHLDREDWHPHADRKIKIWYAKAHAAASAKTTQVDGTLVFTGKPQTGMSSGHKKQEFVFHSPNRLAASTSTARFDVAADVWRDFELIHCAQPGRPENPNWTFWKAAFDAGKPAPIFYLTDESGRSVVTFGTAFMFKTALPLSTHDMLRNSHADHTPTEEDGRLDLPSLVFGAVAHRDGRGLKRRASFDMARAATPHGSPTLQGPAVLLGPKPSYYPIYIRQPGDAVTGTLDDTRRPFAVASPSNRHEEERARPRLAGVKLWPARGGLAPAATMLPPAVQGAHAIQTRLQTLPAGTRFRTVLRVHNLRAVELGAVLWAITFNRPEAWTNDAAIALRHRLGMGKPYGFGEITLRVLPASLRLEANALGAAVASVDDLVNAFVAHMERARPGWAQSQQVRTLLAVADPRCGEEAIRKTPAALNYMRLETKPPVYEFAEARENGRFLPDYAFGAAAAAAAPRAAQPPGPARGAAQPRPPAPAPSFAKGDRVIVGSSRGVVVDVFNEANPPACAVLLDGSTKPIRYNVRIIERQS